MVPVELRLKNFMSYGAEAPALDFEVFRVACLSGRNGQGKSALLDAITWSLWGEARKSSGNQKPDDDLLRIGEREMQVEFVFDVEGERYRVIRSYARSASGKTSRPSLELHVFERGSGEYRPLTAATIRETQELIDKVVGLDYDTFINSAFLLQGRSDEFTKKRPSERKEILARILNLGRYDKLYELAGEREREARKRMEQAQLDIERLQEALEQEPVWKARYVEVEENIQQHQEQLERLRADERCLTERLADLDARARHAETLREAIVELNRRKEQHEKDAADLKDRIAQAERLMSRREEIQRDHQRYHDLLKERDELDTRNELYRGLEKQLERRRQELTERRTEVERQLERIGYEQKGLEGSLAQCNALLARESTVIRNLETARAAKQQFQELSVVLQRRNRIDEQIARVDSELLGRKRALEGQLETLEAQYAREQEALPSLDALKSRHKTLQQRNAEREELARSLEAVRVKGQSIAEQLKERAGVLSARKQELEALEETFGNLRTGDETMCPTCGTELTPEHRKRVRADFERKIRAIRGEIGELEGQLERDKQQRDRLREEYRQIQARYEACAGVPEQLLRVEEEIRRYEESQRALEGHRKQIGELRRLLAKEDFGHDLRAELKDLKEKRAAIEFDEEEFERVREEAAQVERYEEQKRQLEAAAGEKEQLERAIEKARHRAHLLRSQLDDGLLLGPIQEQILTLERQLKEVGFDPQRFKEVKQALDELKDAPARVTDLVNAQQNHVDWKRRLEDVEQRMKKVAEEREQRERELAEVVRQLDGRPALEAKLAAASEACRSQEATLRELEHQRGQLAEKLEQTNRDRKRLQECRRTFKQATNDSNLYKHLRAAFGKHGIPSLIIEQTLPEIEDRANDLLERLTDGKMHIKLETLKDKKTGGTKETLDITITDEQGVSRSYETFSGGEAFRVNFALRIALAQLLAERNGVRIRTLVVDEGFGTQDQQGVQSLVEAIQVIQDDFDKIVVITHLDELKEAFPVRIEVEKDPVQGSRFEVLGI